MNKNEIQPATIQLPADKQPQSIDIHISQTGEGKQYGYVNHYEDHRKVAVVLPQMDDDEEDNTPDGRIELDVSCYNLFVFADDYSKENILWFLKIRQLPYRGVRRKILFHSPISRITAKPL